MHFIIHKSFLVVLKLIVLNLLQEYKVKVHGVDPSANMVALCLERANLLKQNNVSDDGDDDGDDDSDDDVHHSNQWFVNY